MHGNNRHVRPILQRTKAEVSGALVAGWARVAANQKGAFADALDVDGKTINRTLTGETVPELHRALNSLSFDQSALDEVFSLYGLSIRPKQSAAANDMELAAGLGHSLSELIDRLRDGARCHLDTLALAELFRPVIRQMQAVIDEADEIRGVA